MSTDSIGGKRVGWGVHQSKNSRDGTWKENPLSVSIDFSHSENASTLMLHISSKWNKMARGTVYIFQLLG